MNTPDGAFVDVGDLASRESQILGILGKVDHYLWQTSAGSEMLTMLTYPWTMEKAQGDIKRVIMRHDLTHCESKTPEAQEGNCVRYKLR